MEYKQDDPITFYKDIETEMNKRIYAAANCREFTRAFGRAMDTHLKQLRIHRKLTTRWLKTINLPNKDEIAALSVRMVECEEKLDSLDDTLYALNKEELQNQVKLTKVREAWEELFAFLRKEVKLIQSEKLKSLENELVELKQLFQTGLVVEETDDDGKL